MIDLTHIIDFATQLPHPSDLGLVKPSGGFQLVPVIFGLLAIVQVSQFHWYARDENDPSKRFQRWFAKSTRFDRFYWLVVKTISH